MRVDQKWLKTFSPKAEFSTLNSPNIMNAVHGPISLTQKTRFNFYVEGEVNNAPSTSISI